MTGISSLPAATGIESDVKIQMPGPPTPQETILQWLGEEEHQASLSSSGDTGPTGGRRPFLLSPGR